MLYLAVGWVCVGLGAAGVVLPVIPGVPFLIVALWAFSRSSQRFHDWLINHPFLGPPVRRWQEGHVIPVSVKVIALVAMAASFGGLAFATDTPWYVLTAVGGFMTMGAAYILKCPSARA